MKTIPSLSIHSSQNRVKTGSRQMSLGNHQNFRCGASAKSLSLRAPSGDSRMKDAHGPLPSGPRAQFPIFNTSGFRVHPQTNAKQYCLVKMFLGPRS